MTDCGWIYLEDGEERWVTCDEFDTWESCWKCDNEFTWDACWGAEWRIPCEWEANYGEVGYIYRDIESTGEYWVSWAEWFAECM